MGSFQPMYSTSFGLHMDPLPMYNESLLKHDWSILFRLQTDYKWKPECFCLCRYLFIEIRLDLTHFLVFHWQKLGAAPGTCYFLWFHLGQCSKQAEPLLNNGVKILRTTGGSDRLIIRIIPCLPWSN